MGSKEVRVTTDADLTRDYSQSISSAMGGVITPERINRFLEGASNTMRVTGIGDPGLINITSNVSAAKLNPSMYHWATGKDIFWRGSPSNPLGSFGTPFFHDSHVDSSNGTNLIIGVSPTEKPDEMAIISVGILDNPGLTRTQQYQIAEQKLFEKLEQSIDTFQPFTVNNFSILLNKDGEIVSEPNTKYVFPTRKAPVARSFSIPRDPNENGYQISNPSEIERITEVARREQQKTFETIILPWADSLPGASILDLAAGIGIEASLLGENYDVTALDRSKYFIENNLHANAVLGTVDDLSIFENESFHGAMLKDALLFLSPAIRQSMLSEVMRILKPGGSLLIISQDIRELAVSATSRYHTFPRLLTSSDDNDWQKLYTQLQISLNDGEEYEFDRIQFTCSPEKTAKLGEENGFTHELVVKYDASDVLAQENRWVRKDSGFASKLTKPIRT